MGLLQYHVMTLTPFLEMAVMKIVMSNNTIIDMEDQPLPKVPELTFEVMGLW